MPIDATWHIGMNKYVTRKNLMILNGFLGLLFFLVVLKNVIALAPNNEKEPVLDVISGEKHQASPGTARKNMNEFSIITTNNLFSSKRHTTEQSPAKALLPDPTKDWVLQGTASYPEGYHAIIADARQKDPKTGTFTIYDVKEGDKIVKNYPIPLSSWK